MKNTSRFRGGLAGITLVKIFVVSWQRFATSLQHRVDFQNGEENPNNSDSRLIAMSGLRKYFPNDRRVP